jgi:hypothetical protein
MSHPIAIRQCVDFFDEYPQLKVVESNDTAACAKRIRDEQLPIPWPLPTHWLPNCTGWMYWNAG